MHENGEKVKLEVNRGRVVADQFGCEGDHHLNKTGQGLLPLIVCLKAFGFRWMIFEVRLDVELGP